MPERTHSDEDAPERFAALLDRLAELWVQEALRLDDDLALIADDGSWE